MGQRPWRCWVVTHKLYIIDELDEKYLGPPQKVNVLGSGLIIEFL